MGHIPVAARRKRRWAVPNLPRSLRLEGLAYSPTGAMPVGQAAPQFVSDGSLSLTPVPPIPQYPAGFLSRYCWWEKCLLKYL